MYKHEGGVDLPQIRPITDLRNTNEISEICHAVYEPIFIISVGEDSLLIKFTLKNVLKSQEHRHTAISKIAFECCKYALYLLKAFAFI